MDQTSVTFGKVIPRHEKKFIERCIFALESNINYEVVTLSLPMTDSRDVSYGG